MTRYRCSQQVLDRADIRPTHNEDLPFQGGALGLFGYDLGRRFESLPEIAETRYRSAGYGSGYLRLGAHWSTTSVIQFLC
ncbi:para-aminobenzoate synthase component I [Escherichia coli]|uniref:Para-aminobenzoate synthase component I n=1 Tax=Escherichia coli TaxID=562 RepID=A0A376Y9F6_ECOLX|nr:para-aminobenzoate synthase component I [Escherichia coli]